VSHSNNAPRATSLRRRGLWLGLGVVLASSLGWATHTLGQGGTATPPKEAVRSSALAAAQVSFRGPEQATVGQRFTLEVLIHNTGAAPLKDLELVAQPDAHLEQPSGAREHRVAIAAIPSDDLHIVRLALTPRKNGAGGVEVTLRARDGQSDPVRYVMPIVPADPEARQPERAPGANPLQFTITPLKECFAGRPAVFLVRVLNTDTKRMPRKVDLVLSYVTMGRISVPGAQGEEFGSHKMGIKRLPPGVTAKNPIRHVRFSVPGLEAGEARTVPIRLTPRRIGELQIAISTNPNPQAAGAPLLGSARLQVSFDPRAPVAQLLPVRAGATVPTRLPQQLADVPEVSLEDPHAQALSADEAFEHVAHVIERINHVNASKTDAYMEALAEHRSDVRGLPFTLGGACRLPAERGQQFVTELTRLRMAMRNPAALAGQLPNPHAQPNAEALTRARIAALVQVLGPEGTQLGQEMVKSLAALSHVEATQALAKLAIFSEDAPVREDAVAALKKRGDKDCTDILVSGLNYPWPAVAERAADAIVKLNRKDLLPQLVDVLERPDPRAPQLREQGGKKVSVVRELVRINHFRNCLLCHAPASQTVTAQAPGTATPNGGEVAPIAPGGKGMGKGMPRGPVALTAPVPLPGQPIPTPSPRSPYGQSRFSIPETQIAFDVTYLRQDFSVKLPVARAQPWPELQRFDFLVRTREITEKDADAYRALLRPEAGGQSPYQQAALTALQRLTGRSTEPTAVAWRRLLEERK
jgi:hypothetical protein